MKKILLIRNVLITMLTAWVGFGVSLASTNSFAYVANKNTDTVSVIDTATNMVNRTIGVRDDPFDVAITPDGLYDYVVNLEENITSCD